MGKVSINNLSECSERINTPNLPTEKEAVIAGIKSPATISIRF